MKEGYLTKFLERSKDLDCEQRGELLCKAIEIIDAHKEFAQDGQSEVKLWNFIFITN